MKRGFHPKKSRVALLSLSILTALSLPVYAAEEEPYQFNEVVVTATRTENKVKETPTAVEVITRNDIDKLGARTLQEALHLSTSIQISPAMVGSSVSIRGMEGRYVLLLVDGERLTSEGSYSTMNNYEWDRINLDNVERIEIVRGIASSLYGSDALGGIVNVITKTPGKPELSLAYSPGRYSDDFGIGYDHFSVRYDTGKTPAGAWSITAGQSRSDMLQRPDEPNTSNYYGTRRYLDIAAKWDLQHDRQLDFKAGFLKEDMEQLSQISRLVMFPPPPKVVYENGRNYYENERQSYSIGLKGKHQNGDYGLRTYYGKQKKVQDNINYTTGVYTPKLHDNDRTTWTLEGWSSNHLDDNHLLTTGGEFRTETYEGTRVNTGKASVDSAALYVQDEYRLDDRLLLVPSFRYDHNSKFGNNISPKLGMTYNMDDHYRLKANVGKGFRAPSLDDLYIKMSMQEMGAPLAGYIYGNPNLKPEKSTNYEVGLEGEKGKTFGKVSYFVNDVTNLIKAELIEGSTSDYTYVNVNEADINGLEFEVGQHLNNKFMIKFSHTYLDATDGNTHERLTGRAQNQGSLQLHYDNVQENGISAVLWHTWVQDYKYSTTVTKNYNTWNLSVNKKWNDRFDSYIRVDNIFNKKDYDINMWGSLVRVGMNMKL